MKSRNKLLKKQHLKTKETKSLSLKQQEALSFLFFKSMTGILT